MARANSLILPLGAVVAGAALLATYVVVADGRAGVPTGSVQVSRAVPSQPPAKEEPKVEEARSPEPSASVPAGPVATSPGAASQPPAENEPKLEAAQSPGSIAEPGRDGAPALAVQPASDTSGAEPVKANIELAQAQQAQPASAPRPAPAPQPAPAPTAVPTGRQPAPIDRNNVLFLVRSVLLALHQANETGNYSVLRDMSAPSFQAPNSPARLSEIFAHHRAQKLDLAAVSIAEPQLTSTPSIDASGMLLIEGAYPQIQPHVSFRLLFQPVEGRWRLEGISINLGLPVPAQPTASQPAPAPTSSVAPPAQPPAGRRTTGASRVP